MPITTHTPHSYFSALTQAHTPEQTIWYKVSKVVNELLLKIPFIDKAVWIKNLPFVLDQTKLSIQEFRLLRCISILSLWIISIVVLISLQASILIWVLALVASTGIGHILPELYVKDRLSTHQFFLQHAVPEFLDQLHMMSNSTGFESFSQSLKLIAPTFPDPLGKELRTLTTIQPYMNEHELLERLIQICPHPLLKELALSIKLSSQFGTPLSDKTSRLVNTAQQQQEQRTKDLANKTSGILLGPLLVFHLPALLLIFLIPFLFMLANGM